MAKAHESGPSDPRRVVFGPDLRRRLEAFALRLEGARRRREGPGRSSTFGAGDEWVGFRPYRPGDDPRQVDWNLLGRLDRPFVRVTRREASEAWVLAVDTSASMGLGAPGKLQAAAECAAALAATGLRQGAQVTLVAGAGAARRLTRASDLGDGLAFLEGLRADGAATLDDALGDPAVRRAGLVVALGDLMGSDARAVVGLARGGRDVAVAQLLAPHELDPALGPVRWTCPETGDALEVAVDDALAAAYETELSHLLERWRERCGQRRVRYVAASSARPFEALLLELFGGAP